MSEIRAKCENCDEIVTFDADADADDSAIRPCPNCGEEVAVSGNRAEEDDGDGYE